MKIAKSLKAEANKSDINSDKRDTNKNENRYEINESSVSDSYDEDGQIISKKKLICDYCQKEFDFQSALEKHIRIHTGEKPFICDFEGCNVSFAQVSNLIRHKRTHTGEKPFKCKLCDKSFTSTSNLKLHMKSHMDTPKEKLYCFVNFCERFYFSLETLKKHLQKSHKKEYDSLKEEYKNKNFNQIYLIIKNLSCSSNKLAFINFKDYKVSDEEDAQSYDKKSSTSIQNNHKNRSGRSIVKDMDYLEEKDNFNKDKEHKNELNFKNVCQETNNRSQSKVDEENITQEISRPRAMLKENSIHSLNSIPSSVRNANKLQLVVEDNLNTNAANDADFKNKQNSSENYFNSIKADSIFCEKNELIHDNSKSIGGSQTGIIPNKTKSFKSNESSHSLMKEKPQSNKNLLKSKFICTNNTSKADKELHNYNASFASKKTENQIIKPEIFKSSNVTNSANTSSNNLDNTLATHYCFNNNNNNINNNRFERSTINYKINPENSKKFIFNSIPTNSSTNANNINNNNNSNNSVNTTAQSTNNNYITNIDNTFNTFNNILKFTTSKCSDDNINNYNNINNNLNVNSLPYKFSIKNIFANIFNNQTNDNITNNNDQNNFNNSNYSGKIASNCSDQGFSLIQDNQGGADNQNLNRILENSINNFILNFFTRSQISPQQGNQLNNVTNENNNGNIINQLNYAKLLNNNEDYLNLPPNFGNVLMNSLIEAYKQNNMLSNTNLSQPAASNTTNVNFNFDINNQKNYINNNNKKVIIEKNEGSKFVKLKRPQKSESKGSISAQTLNKVKLATQDASNSFKPHQSYKYSNSFNAQSIKPNIDINNNSSLIKTDKKKYFSENNYSPRHYESFSQKNFTKNIDLSLNEKANCTTINNYKEHQSYENSNEYESEQDQPQSNLIVQKSGRIVKKNKLYDSKEFETENNIYKKTIGRKRKNNSRNNNNHNNNSHGNSYNITNVKKKIVPIEIVSEMNYTGNEDDKNYNYNYHHYNNNNNFQIDSDYPSNIQSNEAFTNNIKEKSRNYNIIYNNGGNINNNNNQNCRKIHELLSHKGENNTVLSNIEDELKFPMQKFDHDTIISNRNIEIENSYNLNHRTSLIDETPYMNYSNFNLGGLGTKYIFTPHDQSEVTVDLYNQEILNTKGNTYTNNQLSSKLRPNNFDHSNPNSNYNSIYNSQAENNINNNPYDANVNVHMNSLSTSNLIHNSIISNNPHLAQMSSIINPNNNSGCRMKKNSISQTSMANSNDFFNAQNNTNFSYQSLGHSNNCSKLRHKIIKLDPEYDSIVFENNFNNMMSKDSIPNAGSVLKLEDNSHFIETPDNLAYNSSSFNTSEFRKYSDARVENSLLKRHPFGQNKSAFENKFKPLNATENNHINNNINSGNNPSNNTIIIHQNNLVKNSLNKSASNSTPYSGIIYNNSSGMENNSKIINTNSYNNNNNNNNNSSNYNISKSAGNQTTQMESMCCRTKVKIPANTFEKNNVNLLSNNNNNINFNNNNNNSSNNNNFINSNSNNHVCCHSSTFKVVGNPNSLLNEDKKVQDTEFSDKLLNSHNNSTVGNKRSASAQVLANLNTSIKTYQEDHKPGSCNSLNLNNSIINNNQSIVTLTSDNSATHANNLNNNLLASQNRDEDLSVPVFKKNNSNVKIFKSVVKNREALNSYDRINNFLAPININNYSGEASKIGSNNYNLNNTSNTHNSSQEFNYLSDLGHMPITRNINIQNNFAENKKYPQLCSKNLYLDRHNLEMNPRTVSASKILNGNEDKFLDKKCLEICGDLLICPELLPINCQKYINRECDCVEKCREKDSIFREFIASNKALKDLEF